jgi:hypothetical protein
MYAYIDAERNVLAVSDAPLTVEAAQVKIPEVTARIDGAPTSVKAKLLATLTDVEYHRLKEGAGGQAIGDYDLLEYLDALKAHRVAEIQANTEPILEQRSATWGEYQIAIHQAARDDLDALVTADLRGLISYPTAFPSKVDGVIVIVASTEDLTAVSAAVLSAVLTIKMQGETLKAEIKAATTKAAIDAIIDNR